MEQTHLTILKSTDIFDIQKFQKLEYLEIRGAKNLNLETIYELNNLKTLLLGFLTINDFSFIINTKINFLLLDVCKLKGDLSVLYKYR